MNNRSVTLAIPLWQSL